MTAEMIRLLRHRLRFERHAEINILCSDVERLLEHISFLEEANRELITKLATTTDNIIPNEHY